MLDLTPEQYRILTAPTPIEEWGKQQEIAREVQRQILALEGGTTTLNAFDIAAINKAIEVNREGAFIPSANSMAGGWETTEWEFPTNILKNQVSAS